MTLNKTVPKEFYLNDPKTVAIKLLGKIILRKYGEKILSGYIVETEAYYGREDPASRARRGGQLARMMYGDVGVALIYGVHAKWLFNIVAHKPGDAGAVLIRAIHPIKGIELMKKLRETNRIEILTSGPGRWTQAFAIDKSFHGEPVYLSEGKIKIIEGKSLDINEIISSHRIGVTEDLNEHLRFYIKNDPFVSRK
ncbi:MAG: DNA-3-methyladenine glycosylase [archaeon GB-1867-035]|nr:DNA-3-methyladenine glycosylase [Candidatus Culexmicrobium profundum]